MLPIRHSTIFKSRWWALLWAIGICWTAIDVAGGMDGGNEADNAAQAPDAAMAGLLNAVD